MILVDTSAWIELLNGRGGGSADPLQYLTTGLILQEVLQGLRPGPRSEELEESLLALPRIADPLELSTFLHAADLYRQARRKGITVRTSVDCLIAAIAMEYRVPILHRDRDFDAIASFT